MGVNWDIDNGIELGNNQILYKEGLINEETKYIGKNSLILKYYRKRNMLQHQGNGLGCIVPLTFTNIISAIFLLLKKHKYNFTRMAKRNYMNTTSKRIAKKNS